MTRSWGERETSPKPKYVLWFLFSSSEVSVYFLKQDPRHSYFHINENENKII